MAALPDSLRFTERGRINPILLQAPSDGRWVCATGNRVARLCQWVALRAGSRRCLAEQPCRSAGSILRIEIRG